MKKLIKYFSILIGTVLVLAVALVIVLPLVFDPNDHKQTISDSIKSTIGREVRLDGEIKWSVFPSIALTFNDVKLANDPGFKGEYMAEMAQLSAQVKLLPLLKKDIQVGTVTFKEPQILLQMAASGNSNWQSILDALDSGNTSSSAETTDSSSDLEIRGISITDGKVRYNDTSAGLAFELNAVNFSTNRLSADQDSEIEISAEVMMPNEGLQGQFSSDLLAKNLLNEQDTELVFNRLSFDGILDGDSKLPLTLNSDKSAVLNLGQDSLNFDQLSASLGSLELTTSVTGKNISSNMQLSGDLNLQQFDVDEFVAQLGAPLLNDANNELSGKAQWQFAGNSLKINGLTVNLDDYALTGDVNIKNLEQMRGSFNLAMDSFDADPYIPQSETSATQASSGSDAVLDFGHLDGNITIGKLSFAGLSLDNITLKMATRGADLTVQPLQADFYQGLIKTELNLKPKQQNNKLQLSHRMSDIQAGNMLTDLMGSEYMTGLGQLNADLYVDEPFSERPFKTAHGTIQYRLSDGDIVGIDVFDIIQRSLSLMGNQEAASQNKELKTEFGLMELDATVEQGILKTNTLSLTSPYFDVKGKVTIDLDAQTIKGSIKPMLTNIPEGVLSDDYKKLLNLRIPVALSGSLLEPNISIDVKELILESQKEKIEEKKQELKEDLFNKLLGNDKDKDKKRKNKDSDQPQEENAEQAELTEKQKRRQRKKAQQRALLEGLLGGGDKKQDDEDSDDGTGNGN